jgi:hypothetical protein
MDQLPDDILRHIRSYLYIISWRSEFHYAKLLKRFKECTFETIPSYIKTCCIERPEHFTYPHPHGYYIRVYKWDVGGLRMMKLSYVREYINPLRHYLEQYREHNAANVWNNTSFVLYGHTIHGLTTGEYSLLLLEAAIREAGNYYHLWKGCIPLDRYKKACIKFPSLENCYE